jgi:hypothetical protein
VLIGCLLAGALLMVLVNRVGMFVDHVRCAGERSNQERVIAWPACDRRSARDLREMIDPAGLARSSPASCSPITILTPERMLPVVFMFDLGSGDVGALSPRGLTANYRDSLRCVPVRLRMEVR